MATISNELFLFVCVKHANGGKINFAEVGKECGIKANAAYMRWSCLKEKLDTSPLNQIARTATDDQSDDQTAATGTPKKTPKKRVSKKTPSKEEGKKLAAKKRKLNEDGDEGEQTTTIKEEDD